jgi:protein dpy-30
MSAEATNPMAPSVSAAAAPEQSLLQVQQHQSTPQAQAPAAEQQETKSENNPENKENVSFLTGGVGDTGSEGRAQDDSSSGGGSAEPAAKRAKTSSTSGDVKSLPTRQYLDQTVVPILLEALSALAKERPPEPVDFLTEYLQKHKQDHATR